MGFVLCPGGSQEDPQLHLHNAPATTADQPVIELLLPHLNYLRQVGNILSFDARHQAELHNGTLVEADLISMLGLARQLKESDGFVVTQLVALGVDSMAVHELGKILSQHAE